MVKAETKGEQNECLVCTGSLGKVPNHARRRITTVAWKDSSRLGKGVIQMGVS